MGENTDSFSLVHKFKGLWRLLWKNSMYYSHVLYSHMMDTMENLWNSLFSFFKFSWTLQINHLK